MEKIHTAISAALEEHKTIRILGDLPTERLESENYLASVQALINDLTTFWETKAKLHLIAVVIHERHTFFALDFNNNRYDYQTAHEEAFILPVYILRLSGRSGRWKIFRRVPSDRDIALRIAELHMNEGWETPTPFVEDHLKGPLYFRNPRDLLPLREQGEQEYPPRPRRKYNFRSINDESHDDL